LDWLGSPIVEIEDGFATSGRWGAKPWIANNHAVAGLESLDLVGSSLEAVLKLVMIDVF
jgi:hypothetical protein